MAKLSFGIKTAPQHTTYAAMLDIWQAIDATPVFEHAWLNDHLNPTTGSLDGPCYEGWTTLAALAAMTSRVRIGIMVTSNTYRHPAVLAHIAATIDVICGGRLDLGLGAGWNEYEHHSMDIPLYAPGERVERLGEACELIRRLFTEPVASYAGRFYTLREARCNPRPVQQPYPPFVIGGSGERRTLRVAAQYADVWNYVAGTAEEFSRKVEVLRRHCADVGRDPDQITLSAQAVLNYDDWDETVGVIQSFVDAGATHLILNLPYPYPDGIVARLAEDFVPQIRG